MKKKKADIKIWFKKNKKKVVISAVIIVFLLAIFSTKIALYLNFILGNDIIVKLEAEKEYIPIMIGEENIIKFEASVTTNPFCYAECTSLMEDVSAGKIIESDNFTLRPGNPLTKEYAIKKDKPGEKQDIYRINLECIGKKTVLCHTKEEATTRNVLVIVDEQLNEQEKTAKEETAQGFESTKTQVQTLLRQNNALIEAINEMQKQTDAQAQEENAKRANQTISLALDSLISAQTLWSKQEYLLTKTEYEKAKETALQAEIQVNQTIGMISDYILRYNNVDSGMISAQTMIQEIQNMTVLSAEQAFAINQSINKFNDAKKTVLQKNTIEEKEDSVSQIVVDVQKLSLDVKMNITKETLSRNFDKDVVNCALILECVVSDTNSSVENMCDGINIAINDYETFGKEPTVQELESAKLQIINYYNSELSNQTANYQIIKQMLEEKANKSYLSANDVLKGNICVNLSKEYSAIDFSDVKAITITPSNETLNISLYENLPECCVFGKCESCCLNDECRDNPSNYPVIFIHGHAFNKDAAADYSLDAFNEIQSALEKEGYLNAGTVSLYTASDVKQGMLGGINTPVSMKVSYYFDLFKQPDNYVVVQTKSENIDTYAIRLKDLIDTVKQKTGKPKVKIVAHSMGGLVARRYLQIFGDGNVDKLVMIGTPNQGIRGNTADYCNVFGEALECRDMNQDSLFINKLNRGTLSKIEILNIIGTGCEMDNGQGDGVVLEEDAKLEGAQNVFIKGTCKGTELLHGALLKIEKYPQVYKEVGGFLK